MIEELPPSTVIRYWWDNRESPARVQREVTITDRDDDGIIRSVVTNQPMPSNAAVASETDWVTQQAAERKRSDETRENFEKFVEGQRERREAKEAKIADALEDLGMDPEVAGLLFKGTRGRKRGAAKD